MIHFGEKSEEGREGGREGRKVFVVFVHQTFVLFHLHIVLSKWEAFCNTTFIMHVRTYIYTYNRKI